MPVSKYSKRVMLKNIVGRSDGGVGLAGQTAVIGGWVKSSREIKKDPRVLHTPLEPSDAGSHKDLSCMEVFQSRVPLFRSIFRVLGGGDHRNKEKLDSILHKPPPQHSVSVLHVSDGSCVPGLQVVIDSTIVPPIQVMPTGTCILVEGVLQLPGAQGKHVIELKVEKLLHIGTVAMDKYPLSKKRLPLEMLRDYSHFRPRTTTVASVTRIHNAFHLATHNFFLNQGFLYVEVPIITCTDAEGFGRKFQVTTLLNRGATDDQSPKDDNARVGIEDVKNSINEKSKKVEELKRSSSNREALAAAVQDLKKTNDLLAHLEAREKSKPAHAQKAEKLDFSKDFFGHQAYLTVSGRLHLESYACALGNVYTLGPRFQAAPSESKKSLAEMWMVEVEMAFTQMKESMECAVEFLKSLCQWTLDHCHDDLKFIAKRVDKAALDRLQSLGSGAYEKITYAEAVEVLKQVKEKKFEAKVEYGASLTEEQESYLSEEIYKRPLIIFNHPKELQPFYVRLNDDGKTVAAFDIILPKAGNVIRGSQNEERLDLLAARMKEMGLPRQEYEWYLDLRKHGAVTNSGFTLALDTMVLYATGLNDLKDVVPFPRSFGKAND